MIRDVRDFQLKLGHILNDQPTHLTQRKLWERIECLQEELNELVVAWAKQDLAAQADALVDLVYFALGTANMLGLPWGELWEAVHEMNMCKERGVTKRGHQVDAVKPEGWQPPDLLAILKDHGYDPRRKVYHDDDIISLSDHL